ncbi:unnamed protein product [Arctia plantaginis]|uniref:Uncharacterized protein n=1 Tax=Arctia plantaginis TaxID=874455 RepID=A0A8S0Z0B9_ARCPL|nr:unnamed protein product [Arctia plantaginis]
MRPPPTSRPLTRTAPPPSPAASSDVLTKTTPIRHREAAPPRQSAMESPAPRSLCSSTTSLHSAEGDSDTDAHTARPPSVLPRTEVLQAAPLPAGSTQQLRRTQSFSVTSRPAPMETDAPRPQATARRPRSPEENNEAKRYKPAPQRDPRLARQAGLDEGRSYARVHHCCRHRRRHYRHRDTAGGSTQA